MRTLYRVVNNTTGRIEYDALKKEDAIAYMGDKPDCKLVEIVVDMDEYIDWLLK